MDVCYYKSCGSCGGCVGGGSGKSGGGGGDTYRPAVGADRLEKFATKTDRKWVDDNSI